MTNEFDRPPTDASDGLYVEYMASTTDTAYRAMQERITAVSHLAVGKLISEEAKARVDSMLGLNVVVPIDLGSFKMPGER